MAACGLVYQGMQQSELEDAVIRQQTDLWELAQQALSYEVTFTPYDPETAKLDLVAPTVASGSWLKPKPLDAPEIMSLDLPPTVSTAVDGDVTIDSISIPTRATPVISTQSPDAPGELEAEPPEALPLTDVEIEGMDDFPAIDEVVLTDLQVPSIVELVIPGLPEPPPELTLDIQTQAVQYNGSDYTATAALIQRIMSWLDGGTRMPDAVWSMIIDKAVATALTQAQQAGEQAMTLWAAKGFEFAGGPLDKQLRGIYYTLAATEQNKIGEVLGAQAQQELENLQLAVAQGTALEGQLSEAWHKERMRELTAARATVRLAIETIDTKIALINAQMARYVDQAEIYAAYVRGVVLEYKRYALAIEAQGINSLYNKNATAKYVAEIRGLLKYSRKFAAEMKTLRVIAEHNKNVAAQYRIAVSAGAQKYAAAEEAWRGWLTQYEVPQADADRYRLLSANFAERTRAWSAGIDLENLKVRADVIKKRARTKEVERDIARFLEEATAKQTEIEETSRAWSTFFGSYPEYYQAWSSAIGVDEANQRAALTEKTLNANAQIAAVTEDFDILAAQRRLEIDREGGNAEIKSNLGAAMYNIIHISSSIGTGVGANSSTTCSTTIT